MKLTVAFGARSLSAGRYAASKGPCKLGTHSKLRFLTTFSPP
jgi:hypothetical protein